MREAQQRNVQLPSGIWVRCNYDAIVKPQDLKPHPKNSNFHPEEQIAFFREILRLQGFRRAATVSTLSGCITRGHGLVMAAFSLGTECPVEYQDYESEAVELADLEADNELARRAVVDMQKKVANLEAIKLYGFDVHVAGISSIDASKMIADFNASSGAAGAGDGSNEGPDQKQQGSEKLADRFLVAPFSVLNAREGWWQERKRAWLALGIQSEVGRGANLLKMSDTMLEPDPEKRAAGLGAVAANEEMNGPGLNHYRNRARAVNDHDWNRARGNEGQLPAGGGTSIFDPVLCELVYRWFSPPGGAVLDPFAGGSVRGIVAAKLGRRYTGIELRQEQVDANVAQQGELISGDPKPFWLCGDSREMSTLLPGLPLESFDLVFSCPPYLDLEVYSEDPRDLSTMDDPKFEEAYGLIIFKAVQRLKQNRFAVFVVGEVRDKKTGRYRGLVQETIAAFARAGADFYNEAILVTAVGTLALRAAKAFTTSRKLGKTHQNVLVFCKGDPREATKACGEIEIDDSIFGSQYGEPLDVSAGTLDQPAAD